LEQGTSGHPKSAGIFQHKSYTVVGRPQLQAQYVWGFPTSLSFDIGVKKNLITARGSELR
jgi:hypothetical protein